MCVVGCVLSWHGATCIKWHRRLKGNIVTVLSHSFTWAGLRIVSSHPWSTDVRADGESYVPSHERSAVEGGVMDIQRCPRRLLEAWCRK